MVQGACRSTSPCTIQTCSRAAFASANAGAVRDGGFLKPDGPDARRADECSDRRPAARGHWAATLRSSCGYQSPPEMRSGSRERQQNTLLDGTLRRVLAQLAPDLCSKGSALRWIHDDLEFEPGCMRSRDTLVAASVAAATTLALATDTVAPAPAPVAAALASAGSSGRHAVVFLCVGFHHGLRTSSSNGCGVRGPRLGCRRADLASCGRPLAGRGEAVGHSCPQ